MGRSRGRPRPGVVAAFAGGKVRVKKGENKLCEFTSRRRVATVCRCSDTMKTVFVSAFPGWKGFQWVSPFPRPIFLSGKRTCVIRCVHFSSGDALRTEPLGCSPVSRNNPKQGPTTWQFITRNKSVCVSEYSGITLDSSGSGHLSKPLENI